MRFIFFPEVINLQINQKAIWEQSLQFLSTYQALRYNKLPLNLLLLRDFQKFIQKNKLYSTTNVINSTLEKTTIQESCEPYLLQSKPNTSQKGHILVRAQLYPLFKEAKNKNIIYLAHYKKEFEQMKNLGCSPLLLLKDIPEKELPPNEDAEVYKRLEAIQASQTTPDLLKNKEYTKWLNNQISLLLKRIRRIHTLFDQYNICKVIYGSTINRHGSLVTTFAQTRQIVTVNIQHGIFCELGHFPVNADINLVWGKSHKNYLEKHGALNKVINTIGPVFLRTIDGNNNKQNSPLKEEEKFTILVAMQPLGFDFNQKMISDLENVVHKMSEKIRVLYKMHPDQSKPKRYKKLLLNDDSKIIPHGKISLNELINSANLTITPFSTVAFESLLNNKIVVFYGELEDLYYIKDSPVTVKTYSELQQVLSRILQDKDFLSLLHSTLTLKDSYYDRLIKSKKLLKLINKLEKNLQ